MPSNSRLAVLDYGCGHSIDPYCGWGKGFVIILVVLISSSFIDFFIGWREYVYYRREYLK